MNQSFKHQYILGLLLCHALEPQLRAWRMEHRKSENAAYKH